MGKASIFVGVEAVGKLIVIKVKVSGQVTLVTINQ
jgi:hypothetical protein